MVYAYEEGYATMPPVRPLVRARRKDSGGTMLEYALCVTIVALSALAATQVLGCRVNAAFTNVTHTIAKAF